MVEKKAITLNYQHTIFLIQMLYSMYIVVDLNIYEKYSMVVIVQSTNKAEGIQRVPSRRR